MLQLPDTDLKQTRFYQEVFAEGEQEGIEQALSRASRRAGANLIRLTSLDDAVIAAGVASAEIAALRQADG
jgi:predicted transposase YdaD